MMCYSKAHIKCCGVTPAQYRESQASVNFNWSCNHCYGQLQAFPFADCSQLSSYENQSYIRDLPFLNASNVSGVFIGSSDDSSNNSLLTDISVDDKQQGYSKLLELRKTNIKECIAGYLNINSIASKFEYIQDYLGNNLLDILCIAETKLNSSFPSQQFNIDGFRIYRDDRTCNKGGGLLSYVRSDIPSHRRKDLEIDYRHDCIIETLCVDVYDLKNVITEKTCFKSPSGTLIDVC